MATDLSRPGDEQEQNDPAFGKHAHQSDTPRHADAPHHADASRQVDGFNEGYQQGYQDDTRGLGGTTGFTDQGGDEPFGQRERAAGGQRHQDDSEQHPSGGAYGGSSAYAGKTETTYEGQPTYDSSDGYDGGPNQGFNQEEHKDLQA